MAITLDAHQDEVGLARLTGLVRVEDALDRRE